MLKLCVKPVDKLLINHMNVGLYSQWGVQKLMDCIAFLKAVLTKESQKDLQGF